ncbi:MAG: LysR substrate-binding domain-containing protein, partial [Janthinobacterium lividum]
MSEDTFRRRPLPPLNAVRAFEAAARLGSLKQAGAELGVTHGAISRQIGLLEEWMGPPRLFRQVGRRAVLTAEGEALLLAVRPALDQIAAAARTHRDRRGVPAARPLRINALATFSLRWLLPRLTLFRAAHPEIAVQLTTSNDPLEALSDDYDVVIRGGPDSFHGFTALPVLAERRLPVCSPMLLKRIPLRTIADLEQHTLLHVSTMPRLWRDWLTAAGHGDLQPVTALTLDHFYLSLQAAIDGLGIAIGPTTLIADDLVRGRLVTPFPSLSLPARSYYAYIPAREPMNQNAKTFCDWLSATALEAPSVPMMMRHRPPGSLPLRVSGDTSKWLCP